MSRGSEFWVLCDGAIDKQAPVDALRLTLGDRSDSMTLGLSGIDAVLGGRLTHRFADLLRIATFVLGADGALSRGRLEDEDDSRWQRNFRMVVPVDDPEFWTESGAASLIEKTLSFLSQDAFQFSFRKRKSQAHQLHFAGPDGDPCIPWGDINHVSLFSGGLDSLTGAADLVLREKSKVILVSHLASPKIQQVQSSLASDLSELARERELAPPRRLVVNVTKHEKALRTEHTQRTRSFLYAAIAGATANLIGLDEVRVYENGVIAINLPIAGSVVGARGTRTAHPRVLLGFQKILSIVANRPMRVHNPYALMTRAEVIGKLAATPALSLAKYSVSCAHVHKLSIQHPHCGVCSQCIDRRFAFLGSDLEEHDPSEGYAHSVETDAWAEDDQRALILNWVSRAQDYGAQNDADAFMDTFGDAARTVGPLMELLGYGSEEANAAVFQLHRRHAAVVDRAITAIQRSAIRGSREGQLSAQALPLLLAQRMAESAGQVLTPRSEASVKNEIRRAGDKWAITFRNSQPVFVQDGIAIRCLTRLLQEPGRVMTTSELLALDAGRPPPQRIAIAGKSKNKIVHQIKATEQERDIAQECSDASEAVRCQALITALEAIVQDSVRPTTKESIAGQKLVDDLTALLGKLTKLYAPLGSHLKEHVRVDAVSWYRQAGLHWSIEATAESEDPSAWVPASSLIDRNFDPIKNAAQVARFCDAHGVPTRPGTTKSGTPHRRRRDVHRLAFEKALRDQHEAVRRLDDAADRVKTEAARRSGDLSRPNSAK